MLGVGSFLQTDDRRFKLFMTGECLPSVAHFAVVAANIVFALAFAQRASDGLPLAATCLGTIALFLLEGIPMRLLMQCGTGLWIANNLIVGSIGGTALEIVVAGVNAFTIVRLWRQRAATGAGAA